MPPFFLITVDLGNGRWLTVGPSETGARATLLRSLTTVFAGTVLIGAIAFLTSRGLVAPLGALAAAADRLGRERETTDLPRPRIPELAAIHDAFEAMQRRLKRFIDERTHMLAAISHDLRTPLARLRLQADVADQETAEAATDADILERLPRIESLSVRIDHAPPRHLADPAWPLNRVVATVRSKLPDHPERDAGCNLHEARQGVRPTT